MKEGRLPLRIAQEKAPFPTVTQWTTKRAELGEDSFHSRSNEVTKYV
jgi:hypothetical protein